MKYYLAVDIGASSGRHILAHLEDGKIILEEIYRFQNGPKEKILSDGEEHLIWDTERLFSEILNGLCEAKKLGKIPYSIGIDTWGVDYALLDENDNLIENVFCYRDSRTEKTIPLVHNIIPKSELFKKTGIAFAPFNTIYQLYHDKLTGKLESAKSFLMLPDYFHFLLTGNKRQEYTMATTTSMLNAKTHVWDEEILSSLGYPNIFNAPTAPSASVGELKPEIAKIVGYNAKVTLPATHDTASAVLAAPLTDGAPYISSGTWSLLGIEQPNAHTDEVSESSGYSNEGGLNYSFRLQKNIMGLWMIQQVRHELGDKYSFAELAKMARESVVDDEIDVNDNRFLAPKNMTAEIHAAVGRELTVGECAYVIFNNLAKDYARSLTALESITGKPYDTLHIFGGGCQNQLLNELTEKHTGKRIITGPIESTALGNLLLQMIGAKEIADINEGREIVIKSFEIK